jgi:undecaprenyl-diphosphatase
MLGASILELRHKIGVITQGETTNILVGFVVSFVIAYLVIGSFLAVVKRHGLKPFGWYRIAAGLALFAWIALG